MKSVNIFTLALLICKGQCLRPSWNGTHENILAAGSGHILGTSVSYVQSSGSQVSKSPCPTQPVSTTLDQESFYVVVGANGDLRFEPDSINANIGDVVFFDFLAKNHTLTQSSLTYPCQNQGGFDTGFNQFNPRNESGKFTLRYQVETLDSQWFFCAQSAPKSHCQSGMLFALNPRDNMQNFVSAAAIGKPSFSNTEVVSVLSISSLLPSSTGSTSLVLLPSSPTGQVPSSTTTQAPISAAGRYHVGVLAVLCSLPFLLFLVL